MKKTFVFTNENSRKLIEGIINDEAVIKNTNFSFLFESHALNELLTGNKYIDNWITKLYVEENSIGEIIRSIFYYNSVGICGGTQQLPLFEIIDFLIYLNNYNMGKEPANADWTEILNDLNHLIEFCENKYKNEELLQKEYESLITSLHFIEKNLEGIQGDIRENDFYVLVKEKYQLLKDSTYTFRLLSNYVVLKEFYNVTPKMRYDFVNLLRDLAKKWSDEN